MIPPKENKNNNYGTAIFIVLFFVFVLAFAGNSDAVIGKDFHFESLPDFPKHHIALNDIQQLPVLKNTVQFIESTNFKLFGDGYKVIVENRTIQQLLYLLLKEELLIYPVINQRFYLFYHSIDTEDSPILS